MNESKTTTLTPAVEAIAEAARLREYLSKMTEQAAHVEALARQAYADQQHEQTSPLALARIAVLEADNAAQREQIVKLYAALNYGLKPPQTPCMASDNV